MITLKEALEAKNAHCTVLAENIAVIEDFDLSPFEESDINDLRTHLDYIKGLCKTYLALADGFDPDEE